MDILRKEIDEIYALQHLDREALEPDVASVCHDMVRTCVAVNGDCRVITDASADRCTVFPGRFGAWLIGDDRGEVSEKSYASSDEDVIYTRMHPEDLAEKRMLEYEFFRFIHHAPIEEKLNYKAVCRIRIRNGEGEYAYVANSTQLLRLSPAGKFWLILCCYDLSADTSTAGDISPAIVNSSTGEVRPLTLDEKKKGILSPREKDILHLIREGMASKQIADRLNISIHTVNRHRQNILEKLRVSNSTEAVMAASAMKLL